MVERIDQPSPLTSGTYAADHPLYAKMETTQEKVNPFLGELSQVDTHPVLDNATSDTYKDILDLADEIRDVKGMQPLERGSTIRSLHALLVRIAELTEKHIFQRKEKDHKKKEDILGKNEEISNWTRRQGYANFGSGVGYPMLLIVGSLIGGPVSSALQAAKDLVPAGARGIESWFESIKQPMAFDKDIYIQTASSEKQSLEGLKNMPRELQQKLQQMLRQELEAIRASGQRG